MDVLPVLTRNIAAMDKLLEIINIVLANKGAEQVTQISPGTKLRDDLGLTSFDLAELTVRIEDQTNIDIFADGLVETAGEILVKLNLS